MAFLQSVNVIDEDRSKLLIFCALQVALMPIHKVRYTEIKIRRF